MNTILIDANEIASARTGVPRATFLDIFPLAILFDKVGLLIEKEKSASFKTSIEYAALNEDYFRSKMGIDKIELIDKRISNTAVWLNQLLGSSRSKKTLGFNFTYASLFPGTFLNSNTSNILRLHDPFGSSRKALKEVFKRGKIKHRLARALRTGAFIKGVKANCILVANSEVTKNKFEDIYGINTNSIHVIWPSIGFAIDRQSPDFPRSRYILSVMGQRQRKNPVFVINAWARIAARVELDFINVGQVPTTSLSLEAKKLAETGRLQLLDVVSKDKLEELQSEAYLSVFCSSGEGFGLPIAESIFHGVPVLHNDLPVFSEVSGNLISPFSLGDSDSFIESIIFLDQNQRAYGDIRKIVWERGNLFTHETAARRWNNILKLNNS